MEWYYVEKEQQVGPVSDAQFQELIGSGKIAPTTLVWNSTMSNWQPCQEVKPQGAAPLRLKKAGAKCTECGKEFPDDELVAYNEARVCAGCKAVFFQRVKESGAIPSELRYAGFWIRVCANIVDGIIGAMIGGAIGFMVGMAMIGQNQVMAQVVNFCLGTIFGIVYTIFFLGKYGATPGKMACGLKVVRPDGTPISYARAGGRYFGNMLSAMILGIGYLMVAFDPEKRALHDRICDTRVIKK